MESGGKRSMGMYLRSDLFLVTRARPRSDGSARALAIQALSVDPDLGPALYGRVFQVMLNEHLTNSRYRFATLRLLEIMCAFAREWHKV
jgi:hypothetical protein